MNATHSRQRTVPVTCSTRRRTISSGSLIGCASTLATTGTTGGFTSVLRQRLRHGVGGRLHQRAMERRGHLQHHRALGALGLGDLDRALDRRLVAGHHHLPAAIVVGGLADLALRGLGRDRSCGIELEAEQRRHRAGADRHRLLHGAAADAQKPRGVGDA